MNSSDYAVYIVDHLMPSSRPEDIARKLDGLAEKLLENSVWVKYSHEFKTENENIDMIISHTNNSADGDKMKKYLDNHKNTLHVYVWGWVKSDFEGNPVRVARDTNSSHQSYSSWEASENDMVAFVLQKASEKEHGQN